MRHHVRSIVVEARDLEVMILLSVRGRLLTCRTRHRTLEYSSGARHSVVTLMGSNTRKLSNSWRHCNGFGNGWFEMRGSWNYENGL